MSNPLNKIVSPLARLARARAAKATDYRARCAEINAAIMTDDRIVLHAKIVEAREIKNRPLAYYMEPQNAA